MSKNYSRIKTYYKRGLWTKEMVHACVPAQITEEEYTLIVGEPYEG